MSFGVGFVLVGFGAIIGAIFGAIFGDVFGDIFGDILGDIGTGALLEVFAFGLIGGFIITARAKTSFVSIGGVTDFATMLSFSFQQDFERAVFMMS